MNDIEKEVRYKSSFYNIKVKRTHEGYLVEACQHYTWDYYLGKGKTREEAFANLKPVINMYDKNFHQFQKENFEDIPKINTY